MDPCPACGRLARSVIRAAQMFGGEVAGGKTSERVCEDHLPLVVGFTAPMDLATWLLGALAARQQDPSAFGARPCPLCDALEAALEISRGEPVSPFTCTEHGGEEAASLDRLRRSLESVAAGEALEVGAERRILRTALVLYASVRGTSAFIPRIE